MFLPPWPRASRRRVRPNRRSFRVLLLKALRDRADLRRSLRVRDAGGETSIDRKTAIVAFRSCLESQRCPHIDGAQVADLDVRRDNAHDRVTRAVEHDRRADQSAITAEMPLPESDG